MEEESGDWKPLRWKPLLIAVGLALAVTHLAMLFQGRDSFLRVWPLGWEKTKSSLQIPASWLVALVIWVRIYYQQGGAEVKKRFRLAVSGTQAAIIALALVYLFNVGYKAPVEEMERAVASEKAAITEKDRVTVAKNKALEEAETTRASMVSMSVALEEVKTKLEAERTRNAAPPEIDGLRFTKPIRVASPDREAAYAYEIVAQVSAEAQSLGIKFTFSREITGASWEMPSAANPGGKWSNSSSLDSPTRFYEIRMGNEAITPKTPLTIRIWGKEDFRLMDVKRTR